MQASAHIKFLNFTRFYNCNNHPMWNRIQFRFFFRQRLCVFFSFWWRFFGCKSMKNTKVKWEWSFRSASFIYQKKERSSIAMLKKPTKQYFCFRNFYNMCASEWVRAQSHTYAPLWNCNSINWNSFFSLSEKQYLRMCMCNARCVCTVYAML